MVRTALVTHLAELLSSLVSSRRLYRWRFFQQYGLHFTGNEYALRNTGSILLSDR